MLRRMGHACGKIILSGNTANRFGKRALAVPVDLHIFAAWDKSNRNHEELRITWPGQRENGIWWSTVLKIIKLIEGQIGPIYGKLRIRNTLPLGKGMGSSTAIVVAVSRCLLGDNCRAQALAIEDIVNKGHSGLDFAAIWEERPIVIQGNKYEFTDVPKGLQRGVLVDTGLPNAPTSIIIQDLKERLPKQKRLMDAIEIIGKCTERLLSGEDPLTVFPDHCRGLIDLGVVPPRVRSVIEKIQRLGGAAKPGRFGGAKGGAGMIFAVHPNFKALKQISASSRISLIYDPSRNRFTLAPQDKTQRVAVRHSIRVRSKRTSQTAHFERIS